MKAFVAKTFWIKTKVATLYTMLESWRTRPLVLLHVAMSLYNIFDNQKGRLHQTDSPEYRCILMLEMHLYTVDQVCIFIEWVSIFSMIKLIASCSCPYTYFYKLSLLLRHFHIPSIIISYDNDGFLINYIKWNSRYQFKWEWCKHIGRSLQVQVMCKYRYGHCWSCNQLGPVPWGLTCAVVCAVGN